MPAIAEERRDEAIAVEDAAEGERVEERPFCERCALRLDPDGRVWVAPCLADRCEAPRREILGGDLGGDLGGSGLRRLERHAHADQRTARERKERDDRCDRCEDPLQRAQRQPRGEKHDHAEERVEHQDVAEPDDRPVHDADDRQEPEPPKAHRPGALPRRPCARGLHRKSEAEQHREERDELEAAEGVDEEPRRSVRRLASGPVDRDGGFHDEAERPEEEPRIDEKNAKQRNAAGDVDATQALGGCDGSKRHGGHRTNHGMERGWRD